MTEGQTPEGEPTPISEDTTTTPAADPPPLAPYVQGAGAASAPEPAPAPAPAAPPPPVTWAAPPAAVAVAGGRTGLAAAAGIIMLVLGVLGGLLGLFVAVVGGSIVSSLGDIVDVPGMNDPGSVIGGVVAFFGIIVVVYSLLYVFGGIGILRSRGWGRVMGLIVGILSGLVWLSGLGQSDTANMPFAIVMLAIHAYIVVVLVLFWRAKAA
jgi:hypothetical protein